jgi:hypothetical protein
MGLAVHNHRQPAFSSHYRVKMKPFMTDLLNHAPKFWEQMPNMFEA